MEWTIYCHTHRESGRKYIGQTVQGMMRRWRSHVRGARKPSAGWPFAKAIVEFGAEAFDHQILEVCDSPASATEAEDAWSEAFSTRDPAYGFNVVRPNRRTAAHRREDVRARMSASAKARWAKPEEIEKLKAAMASPDTKALMSANGRAQWADPEIAAKNRAAVVAALATPEGKAKLSLASKARMSSPETVAKVRAGVVAAWAKPEFRTEQILKMTKARNVPEKAEQRSRTAKESHSSPETRAKSSETAKAQWADPAERAKLIEANRAAKSTPEYRAAQSSRSKAQWQDPEKRAKNMASLAASAAVRGPMMKARPCKKCGGPRVELADGSMRCKPCHAARELARKIAKGDPTAGTRGARCRPQRKLGEPCPIDGTMERSANGQCRECRCRARREANAAAGRPTRGRRAPYKTRRAAETPVDSSDGATAQPPTLGA